MRKSKTLTAALALSIGMSTPALAANPDAKKTGLPLVSYGDYSEPAAAVAAACREGRLGRFLEGLDIPPDCTTEGQARIATELDARKVTGTCEELTRDGKILVGSFNQDRTEMILKDQECEGQTFMGFTDAQRQHVISWYKTTCENPVKPDVGLPTEEPRKKSGELSPALPAASQEKSIVCPPQARQSTRYRDLGVGVTTPWERRGYPAITVNPSFGKAEDTSSVPCRRILQ